MQRSLSEPEAEALASEDTPVRRREVGRYLVVLMGGFVALLLLCGVLAVRDLARKDHIGQITLDGDPRWYQNYAHGFTREMQDRDVLFHRIGRSVAQMRQADIIVLGHSVLQFGIVDDMVAEFQKKHGVKVYNLTTPGIASGEFVRRLIRKYRLAPKIWVVNADNYPADFFSSKLDDFFASGRNSVFEIVRSGKLQAYLQVVTRSIRWRLETAALAHWPAMFGQPPAKLQHSAIATWRNIETGNFFLDRSGSYTIPGKPFLTRASEDCRTTPEEVAAARDYLAAIGQAAVLTLVPYDNSCSFRVRQLAEELGVESVIPPATDFAGSDGRHMTKSGAERFTRMFLAGIEDSRAFKLLKGQPDPGLPARTTPRVASSSAIEICLSNPGASRLFVSVRTSARVVDHIVEAGASLRLPGTAQGTLCSGSAPFNRNECPNERTQQAAICP